MQRASHVSAIPAADGTKVAPPSPWPEARREGEREGTPSSGVQEIRRRHGGAVEPSIRRRQGWLVGPLPPVARSRCRRSRTTMVAGCDGDAAISARYPDRRRRTISCRPGKEARRRNRCARLRSDRLPGTGSHGAHAVRVRRRGPTPWCCRLVALPHESGRARSSRTRAGGTTFLFSFPPPPPSSFFLAFGFCRDRASSAPSRSVVVGPKSARRPRRPGSVRPQDRDAAGPACLVARCGGGVGSATPGPRPRCDDGHWPRRFFSPPPRRARLGRVCPSGREMALLPPSGPRPRSTTLVLPLQLASASRRRFVRVRSSRRYVRTYVRTYVHPCMSPPPAQRRASAVTLPTGRAPTDEDESHRRRQARPSSAGNRRTGRGLAISVTPLGGGRGDAALVSDAVYAYAKSVGG